MIDVGTGKPIWALGMMSGTSMDGVDAALVMTDGEEIDLLGPSASHDYSVEEAGALRAAIDWAARQSLRTPVLRSPDRLRQVAEISAAEAVIAEGHVAAIGKIRSALDAQAEATGVDWTMYLWETADAVRVIGFHGQTILHRPDRALTIQIGDPGALIGAGGFPAAVVSDFRAADMAAGGQGAPLAPFFHHALALYLHEMQPVAFLNIGGVANVTWVNGEKLVPEDPGALCAFDTGPGNALVNDWMLARTGSPVDRDGATAAAGRVHRDRPRSNWAGRYLRRPPPKSLDRNDFHGILEAIEGLSTEDGAATLTAFTADCVAASLRHMPSAPARWLVCGGGRKNATMMKMLRDRLGAPVDPVEAVGLDGDMLEAQAFAYLAVRVLRGLPTSAPATTGCRAPVCGGRISYP